MCNYATYDNIPMFTVKLLLSLYKVETCSYQRSLNTKHAVARTFSCTFVSFNLILNLI